jgi:hypothetical protein
MQEWRKENKVDELFLNVDIDDFEKTRRLVRFLPTIDIDCMGIDLLWCSTLNGPGEWIIEECHCLSRNLDHWISRRSQKLNHRPSKSPSVSGRCTAE